MSGLRVVVVGATGNVGSSVVEALSRDPSVETIVGLARRPTSWQVPKVSFAELDITTDDLLRTLQGADVVVHVGWLFQPSHRPLVTWRTNVLGTERLFAASSAAGVRAIVYASSIGAYSRRFVPGARTDESWPTHSIPTAAYGREKAYVERLLDVFEARHPRMRIVRMRPAFIFKRAASTEQRRLFAGPFVPNRLFTPGRLPVLPFPTGMRLQAVHSRDVADAFVRAVTGDARGAFNLAAEPPLTGEDLADILGARHIAIPRRLARSALWMGWHARLVPTQPQLLDLALDLPIIDASRAVDLLGWRPRYSSREAIEEMLHGIRSGAGGPTAPLARDRLDRRIGEAIGNVVASPRH